MIILRNMLIKVQILLSLSYTYRYIGKYTMENSFWILVVVIRLYCFYYGCHENIFGINFSVHGHYRGDWNGLLFSENFVDCSQEMLFV